MWSVEHKNKKSLMISRKFWKKVIWTLGITFALMNIVAIFHAYKFTHFANSTIDKTRHLEQSSIAVKIKALVFGINNPRPINKTKPNYPFQTIVLQNNKKIDVG
jgi:hypothetical protein